MFVDAVRIEEENELNLDDQEKQEFTVMKEDFLTKEVHRILGTRRAADLFTNTDEFKSTDEFEKLQGEMMKKNDMHKFTKRRNELILCRLMLVTQLRIAGGPRYIMCVLERLKFVKQNFVLELEQGKETMIPKALSTEILPQSFRYYDPLIKIT